MLSRILIVFSIALFLVTILELGILAYGQFAPKTAQRNVNQNQPTQALIPSPSPQTVQNTYINSALATSFLVNTFEGTITQINKTPGVTNQNFQYELEIIIKGAGDNPSTFFFNTQMLSLTDVDDSKNPGKTIRVDDLSIGDRITVRLTWKYDSLTTRYSKFVKGAITKN